MPHFTIALLQLMPAKTFAENLEKGLRACEQAKARGADLALFPEMWNIGYDFDHMNLKHSITLEDDFIKAFREQAQRLEMAIAITFLGRGISKPTNNVALINAQGEILFNYAKVHICSFDPDSSERSLEAGNAFKTAELRYHNKTVKIGAMICFDREFPESARTLMLQGAEIIITPNACFMNYDSLLDDVRIGQFRARAFENMVGVALTNYPSPKNDGHSCAFDVDGAQLILAGEREDIFLATFDLEKMRIWQHNEVWGSKFRRPECYKIEL